MKTQTYGLSHDSRIALLVPFPATPLFPSQFAPSELSGNPDNQDAAPGSALGNYIANRGNGVKSDSPSRDLPVDGTWSWQESKTKGYHYRLRYDEGPGDRAWMEERDRNYLARLEHEKQAKEQAEQQQHIEEKERELEARNSELEQEWQRRTEKERELEARHSELEQERQRRAEKERELEAKNSELLHERQQRVEKEKELEARNLELGQERQRRAEKERELEAKKSELVHEQQQRAEKERELETRNSELILDLARERQLKEEKARELEATQSKLKTARSALLPTIPNDTVTKEEVFLAKGSYGKVYRGEWLGETIALKELINSELTDDAITEFKEEAFKMAHLRSPYVVTVYGITLNTQGQLQGIVMEYMPQGSLYKILSNREIPLSWCVFQ